MRLGPEQVQQRLDLPPEALEWLNWAAELPPAADATGPDLTSSDLTGTDLRLPSDAEAAELCARMRVRPEDRDEAIAARPDPAAHPEMWWVLERAYRHLVADMGGTQMLRWPRMPESAGAVGRNLYVWVFLAAVPAVRRYHAEHKVPDDVSWDTLGDLGQQLGVHRRIFGSGGLHTHWWLTLAFRGALYELGRLQFNRGTVSFNDPSADGPREGDWAIGVHIPERGPMDYDACEASIDRAREFFPRHFPDEPVRFATCSSWLLDDQLTEYLPESSNIVRFLRRFTLVPSEPQQAEWTPGDRAIVEFVFRRIHNGPDFPHQLIAELPQDTTLQRAVVGHLRSGRHWYARAGWFRL